MRAAISCVLAACVIGGVSGAASVLLGMAFDASWLWFCAHDQAVWVLPAAGVAELALYRALSLPASYGTENIAQAARLGEPVPCTLAAAVLVATCMSVMFGASVGKEAAAVQLCAALAAGVAACAQRVRWMRVDEGLALVCGMAAGIGALLRAPVAGVLMALETVGWRCLGARRALVAGGLAAVSSAVAFLVAYGIDPRPFLPASSLACLWALFPSGGPCEVVFANGGVLAAVVVVCAAAGRLFCVALRHARAAFARACGLWPYAVVAFGGLAIACATEAGSLHAWAGSGFDLLPTAFAQPVGADVFAAKALLVLAALGCGLKGGEIMPALTLGALLGNVVAGACAAVGVASVAVLPMACPTALAAAAGMLAFFATARTCPLSACALAFELYALPALLG